MNRHAATLVEVLVAIFIMALGLLTLLTLFPLGALSMAQAIQDDRAGHAAANAMALAAARNLRNDPVVVAGLDGRDPFMHGTGHGPPAPSTGRSYPVYVDPCGVYMGSDRVADQPQGIPRVTVSWIDQSGLPYQQAWSKTFTLQDDMKFNTRGSQQGVPTHNPDLDWVERQGRYSWAYLLNRPIANDPTVVDLQVVVYSGRLFQLPLGETAYGPVTFDPASNFVSVPYDATQEKPPVRKGTWVLDATLPPPDGTRDSRIPRGNLQLPHGFFYRVVGVSEQSPGVMVLELQGRPRKYTQRGTLIVMENVVEVFEKGIGWQP
jgi:hypothetical protein